MIASEDYPEIFKGNWKTDSAEFIRMKKLDEELFNLTTLDDEEEDVYYEGDYEY